jgi:shikimate kinase
MYALFDQLFPRQQELHADLEVCVQSARRPLRAWMEPFMELSRRERADAAPPRSTLRGVRRVLVTGMSGTGKSSVLRELETRGFDVVDTDYGGWSEWSDVEGGYVWREDRIAELLAREGGRTLYVSGTVSNQGRFYRRFHAVVLLSAPADVLLGRIAVRATNDYGKSSEERDSILHHLAEVEPLLRAICTHEVDATQPLDVVVEQLVAIGHDADG